MTGSKTSADDAVLHPIPAGLVHALRTPLNHIIGFSEMLMEQAQEQGQDSFTPDLQKTHSAGKQLLAIIDANFHPVHSRELLVTIDSFPEQVLAGEVSADPLVPGESAVGMALGRLLVVDDIEANRDVLSRRLERQGYSVALAEDGRQALQRLREDSFDLVLLDIMMPDMDGYEVLQELKADEALRHIPVVMISALTELDSVVRCIELGAEDYMPKPFNPILLKARVGACLEKKRARDREAHLFQQLQENYRRLQELEKLRDDLMHMIIHDLRTPLNGLIMGLQAFGVVGDLNEVQAEMLTLARRSGNTLVGMINELLDISKMESGTLALDRGEVAAVELITAAVQQVATLADAGGLTLRSELAPDLGVMIADHAKLLRTLVNLLGNAVKFTPVGGRITVTAESYDEGSSLRFSVSDTGEGIPPEAFERIFEKFGQVESRDGGRSMSSGLGLTFCKLVVEAHGGRIQVESVPGLGSTFRFTIPHLAAA